MAEDFTTQLSLNRGDLEYSKSLLSVGGSVLGMANCSLAPICRNLHREECLTHSHTCGACLDGFVGDRGAGNTACLPQLGVEGQQDMAAAVQGSAFDDGNMDIHVMLVCSSDMDCSAWEICTPDLGCTTPLKLCVGNCSSLDRGECTPVDKSSDTVVSQFLVDDPLCTARCFCKVGYSGIVCEFDEEEGAYRQAARSALMQGLVDLVDQDDHNPDGIVLWAQSLSSLVQNYPQELSADALNQSLAIVWESIDAIVEYGDVPYFEVVPLLLEVIDAVRQALAAALQNATSAPVVDEKEEGGASSGGDSGSSSDDSFNSLEQVSVLLDLVAADMSPGQATVSYLFDNMRTSVARIQYQAEVAANFILTVPQSEFEAATGLYASYVSVDSHQPSSSSSGTSTSNDGTGSNAEYTVSLLSLSISSSPFLPLLSLKETISNPLRMEVTAAAANITLPAAATVVLYHRRPLDSTSQVFETSCADSSDRFEHNYTCAGSGAVISHTCAGRRGTYTSHCPVLTPTCLSTTISSQTAALSSDVMPPLVPPLQSFSSSSSLSVA